MPERSVIGWDVGGAHVKACLLQRGEVVDVAQWACPLWQGMGQLAPVLDAARNRWPALGAAQHAVTMTGEMVDLFANREDGVRCIAAELARSLVGSSAAPRGSVHFFAGDAGWCSDADVLALRERPAAGAKQTWGGLAFPWEAIASANWLATARHAAMHFGAGLLVDIGSTTTDLIAFRHGRVLSHSRTDAQRLACGELVYHGVVRTPLCALAPRIDWRGTPHNVMNEFFATTADVYRLTGELNPAHDLYPSADNAAKDLPGSRRRLARMIGHDQREGTATDWLDLARSWRAAQVAELGGQLRRVMTAHDLGQEVVLVSAGCGDFLVREVLAHAIAGTSRSMASYRLAAYGRDVARVAASARPDCGAIQAWAQVCAPSVATAALFDMDSR